MINPRLIRLHVELDAEFLDARDLLNAQAEWRWLESRAFRDGHMKTFALAKRLVRSLEGTYTRRFGETRSAA